MISVVRICLFLSFYSVILIPRTSLNLLLFFFRGRGWRACRACTLLRARRRSPPRARCPRVRRWRRLRPPAPAHAAAHTSSTVRRTEWRPGSSPPGTSTSLQVGHIDVTSGMSYWRHTPGRSYWKSRPVGHINAAFDGSHWCHFREVTLTLHPVGPIESHIQLGHIDATLSMVHVDFTSGRSHWRHTPCRSYWKSQGHINATFDGSYRDVTSGRPHCRHTRSVGPIKSHVWWVTLTPLSMVHIDVTSNRSHWRHTLSRSYWKTHPVGHIDATFSMVHNSHWRHIW